MSREQAQALRDIVKGAGIIYIGLVLEVVIAFVAQWLAARTLSVSNFGGITTGLAVINLGAIVGALGLGRGLARYLPRLDADKRTPLVRSALLLSVPAAILLGLMVILSARFVATGVFNDPTVTPSLQVFGGAIPFAAALTISIGVIRGQQKSRHRVYVENIIRPIVRFGLVVVAVLYGLEQFGFALAYAVPYAIGAVAALVFAFRVLPASAPAPAQSEAVTGRIRDWSRHPRELFSNWTQVRELLDYSLPLTVYDAAEFIFRSVDIFILLYFLDSGAVGTYGVAYAVGRLVLMFSTAASYLGTPVASELEAGKGIKEVIPIHRSILRWLAIVSLPSIVPFVFFSTEFISQVYRPRYAAGGYALAILAAGFAIHNILDPNKTLLEALGHSRLLAINTTVAAVSNVALNLALIPGLTFQLPFSGAGQIEIPALGIGGAAIATVCAYLIRDLLILLELRYVTGTLITSWKVLGPAVTAIPLFVVVAAIRPAVPGTLPWIVLVTGIAGLAYLAFTVVVLGFESEEVMLVKSAEEKYDLPIEPITNIVERLS